MRILICGDREWGKWQLTRDFVNSLPDDTIIIEGEARGADNLAGLYGEERGLTVLKFPAHWRHNDNGWVCGPECRWPEGLSAGGIRNQQMLDEGHPDIVVYCHDNLKKSVGTRDMVRRARKAGLPVYRLVEPDGRT